MGTLCRHITRQSLTRWNLIRSSSFISSIESDVAVVNTSGKDRWIIRQTSDKGWGIFALKDFEKGELAFRGKELSKSGIRDSHSVQTAWDTHVHMDLPARFINHSCSANIGILDNDIGAFDFHAIKPIEQGEELTWDYGGAEFKSISFPKYLCGSPKCRKRRIGFEDAHEEIRNQYGEFYAKYLHSWKAPRTKA